MFTGIIEKLGILYKKNKNYITIFAELDNIKIGDSIAINGICLTIKKIINKNYIIFDTMPETFKKTTLKFLKIFEKINLEKAMQINNRFNGHIVQGHIETIAKIISIKKNKNAFIIKFLPNDKNILINIIEKGSIAIDGISLTIIEKANNYFSVSIIPHTYKITNLAYKKIGDFCNIETDILNRNISQNKNIDLKKILIENGFIN